MADPKLSEVIREGYHYLQGFCPKCNMWRTMNFERLTIAPGGKLKPSTRLSELVARLRCHKCNSPMERVEPWRQSDQTGDTVPKFSAKRRRPK